MKAFIKPFEAAQTGLTSEEKSDDTEVPDKTKQKVKTASNKSVNVKRLKFLTKRSLWNNQLMMYTL